MIRNFINKDIVVNFRKLFQKTLFAQIITLLVVPLIGRLFTPDEFGVFSLFTSILLPLTIISCFRYEIAILIPKKNHESKSLLYFSIIISFIFSIFIFIAITILNQQLEFTITPYLYLVPVSVFFFGVSNSFEFWLVRNKDFNYIGSTKVIKSVVTGIFQVSSGFLKVGAVGLIFSQVIGQVLIAILLIKFSIKKFDFKFSANKFKYFLNKKLKKYKDFPMFSAPQAILNSVSYNIPILLMGFAFGSGIVGHYAMALKLIQVPLSSITQTARQILYETIANNSNTYKSSLNIILRSTLILFGIILIPVAVVILFSSKIITFVLGEQWSITALFAKYLMIFLAIQFCNLPTMIYFQLKKLQKYLLIYEIILFVFSTLSIITGSMFTANLTVLLYSLIGFIFNLLLIMSLMIYLYKKSLIE